MFKINNITFFIITLLLSNIAQAEMTFLTNEQGVFSLTRCVLASDAQTSTDGKVCCSKSDGVCIDCRDDMCVETPYPTSGKPIIDPTKNTVKPTAGIYVAPTPRPPSIRDQLKWKKSAPSLPAKAIVIHKKAPGVKPFNSKHSLLSNPRIKAVNK